MAEATQYVFNHQQLAEILIKEQDLHDGLWIIQYQFGIGGANIGPTVEQLNPAAVVPILSIALARTPEPNNLTVDAAKVNPAK